MKTLKQMNRISKLDGTWYINEHDVYCHTSDNCYIIDNNLIMYEGNREVVVGHSTDNVELVKIANEYIRVSNENN